MVSCQIRIIKKFIREYKIIQNLMVNEVKIKSDLSKVVSKIMKTKKRPGDWDFKVITLPYGSYSEPPAITNGDYGFLQGDRYYGWFLDTSYAFTTSLKDYEVTLSYSNCIYNSNNYRRTTNGLILKIGSHITSWIEECDDEDEDISLHFNDLEVCKVSNSQLDPLLKKVRALHEKGSLSKYKRTVSESDKILKQFLKC